MIAIYKRETASMLRSMIGWVVIAVLLGIAGIYFTNGNLNYGLPYFGYVLSSVSFFLVFLCPALTMRTFAEEKRQKTDQLLLTAPVSVGSIVMGKYLALLTVFAIPTGIFALYPLILNQYGAVPMAETYATLLAFFLLGAACLAVGMFFSSITEHQVVAFVTAVVVLVVSYLMTGLQTIITAGSGSALVLFSVLAAAIGGLLWYFTKSFVLGAGVFTVAELALAVVTATRSSAVTSAFTSVLDSLALFDRFSGFLNGTLDLGAYLYLISAAGLFVFFTVQALEKRRWS
ncbi:MAG TPA: ABC transporter permease [Candidatus Anaerofilum faecale]|nr:ABC transporter permease [Candidatus Anaerofilum faecale]